MDRDAIPVFIIVAIIILAGSFFFWQYASTPRPANTAQTESTNPATGESSTLPVPDESTMAQTRQPPEMTIDTSKSYSAILKTSEGDITIAFTAAETPITVNNFVSLARENFYDGTIFHRVIEDFMIQGGDPEGTGRGGPGYRFADEPFEGEYTRGTVAMANAGPNTNGSQFFIMHGDTPLPPNYVIFGTVTSGMEVVDAIATAETETFGEGSTPVEPVMIEAVEIIEE